MDHTWTITSFSETRSTGAKTDTEICENLVILSSTPEVLYRQEILIL